MREIGMVTRFGCAAEPGSGDSVKGFAYAEWRSLQRPAGAPGVEHLFVCSVAVRLHDIRLVLKEVGGRVCGGCEGSGVISANRTLRMKG